MVQLAFPLFRSEPRFNSKSMAKALSKRHRQHLISAEKDDDGVSSIRVNSISVLMKPIAVPVPGDEIENTHQFARRGWHESSDKPEDHRAHAIITTFGSDDAKESAAALTVVMDEICRLPECLGVLWGGSSVLAHRSEVTRFAENVSADEPALSLLVSGIPYKTENGVGLTTRGLADFIGRELHFLPSEQHDPAGLFGRAMDIAEYLYANGPVILDGQSVGYSETDVIRAKWTEETDKNREEPTRWIELTVERLDPST